MNIRSITPDYTVSPQIDPEDLPAIAAAGYTTVINNRPDAENPPSHQSAAMDAAAKAAGVRIVHLPVTHQTLNGDTVAAQLEACRAADGPVLAYCASGTRSTIVWALGEAGTRPTDEIISLAAEQGYDLSQMRPQLEAFAQQKG
ncbi:TIGR01244 family sulfur transferase [Thalassorhabdomicrobium marinisediminis]|uniref:TIGR01244 family sulfur transferase n=1 Tax=Thalassorhabdomicrobium marinisediminis TaxID=2170577 RepID=UPI00248FFC92|nr:TIGR01244 family sulfur transferase [Thalassorhabdomicrobium marinisediminis]